MGAEEIMKRAVFVLMLLLTAAVVHAKSDPDKTHGCNNSCFDPSTHLCCDGKTHTKTSSEQKCCGKNVYEPSEEICCEGKLKDLAPGGVMETGCCGKESYDT